MENESKFEKIFELGREIELDCEEILHDVNDKCLSLGKVISGKLKMSRILSSGREIILKEFLPGEIFGELLVFSGDFYPGWLISAEKTRLIEVPLNDVLDFLTDRDSLVAYMNSIRIKNSHLVNTIEILSLKTVKQKTAYLLFLNGEINFRSITELADKLVCSREALSRALSEMEHAGLISRIEHKINTTDEIGLEQLF